MTLIRILIYNSRYRILEWFMIQEMYVINNIIFFAPKIEPIECTPINSALGQRIKQFNEAYKA